MADLGSDADRKVPWTGPQKQALDVRQEGNQMQKFMIFVDGGNLKVAADFVVQIYEMDLVRKNTTETPETDSGTRRQ